MSILYIYIINEYNITKYVPTVARFHPHPSIIEAGSWLLCSTSRISGCLDLVGPLFCLQAIIGGRVSIYLSGTVAPKKWWIPPKLMLDFGILENKPNV